MNDNINTNARESRAKILIKRWKPRVKYSVVDAIGSALPNKTIVVVINNEPFEFASNTEGKFSVKVPCAVSLILVTNIVSDIA